MRKRGGAARRARRLVVRVVRRFGRIVIGVLPRSLRLPAANDPTAWSMPRPTG